MRRIADKIGVSFLWLTYMGFDVAIVASFLAYRAYIYLKSKVTQPCSD